MASAPDGETQMVGLAVALVGADVTRTTAASATARAIQRAAAAWATECCTTAP